MNKQDKQGSVANSYSHHEKIERPTSTIRALVLRHGKSHEICFPFRQQLLSMEFIQRSSVPAIGIDSLWW